jgi:glycosyltransferase involved in cell wall biosynthesis
VVLPGGIEWHVVTSKTRRGVGSLLTRSPNIGHRHNTTSMRLALSEELDREWDVVLLDHIGSGWALPMLRGHIARHPATTLVYLSQNHEASTRRLVAANAGGNPISRAVLRFDAWKAARLEEAIVAESDLVTVVTAEDAEQFGRPCLVLSPGYLDRVLETRTITTDLPRRAVVVGSFDWVAKRMNLEELLAEADPRFAAAGVELLVVGRGPDDWLDGLRGRMQATRFTGFVDSVIDHLDDARIGIVAERSGGGFKLKVLHYVFNRIPVAALAGSLAGVPLVAGDSDIEAPTIAALVDEVLRVIDDVEELNRLQQRAFDACRGEFEWATRGADLYATLRNLA